jgi:hypothetical protein
MIQRFLQHNGIALLALFIALGGTTYAAVNLPANSVGTKQLKGKAVTAAKIGNKAVTAAKIGNNAVTGAKVKNNSLTGADILESSLAQVPSAAVAQNATHAISADSATKATSADSATKADSAPPSGAAGGGLAGSYPNPTIAAGAVDTAQLKDSAVHAAKLGSITQVTNTAQLAAGANGGVSVQCPTGSVVISGGGQPALFGVEMTTSIRASNGWEYQARNNSGLASAITVFAYCLQS